jgi:hypothetical protein
VNLRRADLSILKVIGCRQMLCLAAIPATDVRGEQSRGHLQPIGNRWIEASIGMTRFRQVPNVRELKKQALLLIRYKLVFLDLQLLDFRVQSRSGNSEFRCRTFWAGDFPFAFSQSGFDDFSLLILESVW